MKHFDDNDLILYHYGEAPAVAGVDLDVHAGETVALLGPSGSGTTTLLYAHSPWTNQQPCSSTR